MLLIVDGDPIASKTCPTCKHTKAHSEFHKNRARYDGLAVYCKACRYTSDVSQGVYSASQKRWQQSPRGRFHYQRANADRRGIEWQLTFEQWLEIWGDKLAQRGRSGYVMGRNGDTGPYAVGNVKILTTQANTKEWRDAVNC